jgi:CRP-like cAMP-binding protein
VSVGGVRLAQVPGLEDLPDEAQAAFAKRAQLVTLGVGEEVGSFAVALVVRGWVDIMPAIADCACAKAGPGQVVFTEGTLDEGIALRAVAGETPTLVAVWDSEALATATHDCPWVEEELRVVADRFQALAGAVMGELGDRLDDALRAQVTDRCELRALLPREPLFNQADEVDGMYVVGVGRIEIFEATGDKSELIDELGPGDFVFSASVVAAGAAPYAARAGARGALLLYASRHDTHELMMLVPPLLEILSA